jgi:NAD-dependent deacetylase
MTIPATRAYDTAMDSKIEKTARSILAARQVVALTGAGISVESGIPPFRGRGGLWEKFDPFEYGHIDTFRRHPAKIWETFLGPVHNLVMAAEPNAAHRGLAQLENLGRLQTVISQNVDGLHQRAGSREVIEFHGNFLWQSCLACGRRHETHRLDLTRLPPRCDCGGILRPACIFFGELIDPQLLRSSHQAASTCDLMLVVGTSAVVQPAATIPEIAKAAGAEVIEINPTQTPLTDRASDLLLKGSATTIVARLVKRVEQLLGVAATTA